MQSRRVSRTTEPVPIVPARASGATPVALRVGTPGREVALSRGGRLAIGSDPSNQIVIDDRFVSAFHCTVELESTRRLVVRDQGSRNGTFVNGARVRESLVEPGARLVVGGVVIAVLERGGDKRRPVLVGEAPAFLAAVALAERAARGTASVLLQGESGTGKELFARLVHDASDRAAGPFVAVNCGAIPRELVESELFGHEKGAFTGATDRRAGFFEQADGGTLFLDELGELPLAQQPALLRVLETGRIQRVGGQSSRPVNVRVVAATNREPVSEVKTGRLRLDLYHRVGVVELRLPPLRERPSDIPLLARQFLHALAAEYGVRVLSPAAQAALLAHDWPGNVRELRNAVQRAVVLADGDVGVEHLFAPGHAARSGAARPVAPPVLASVATRGPGLTLDEVLREVVASALASHGSYRRAAAALGMSRSTLHDRARRFGLGAREPGASVPGTASASAAVSATSSAASASAASSGPSDRSGNASCGEGPACAVRIVPSEAR